MTVLTVSREKIRKQFQLRWRESVVLGLLLALGTVAWQHLLHFTILSSGTDSLVGHLVHMTRDGVLAVMPGITAVLVGLWLASYLPTNSQNRWSPLWQQAALISLIFALLIIPSVSIHSAIDETFANSALLTTDTHIHTSEALDGPLHGIRDALLGQTIVLPWLFALLAFMAWRKKEGPFSHQTPRRTRRRKIWPPGPGTWIVLLFILAAIFVLGNLDVSQSYANETFDNPCTNGGTERVYDVSAIHVDITLNGYGDHDPVGYMYVLDEAIPAVRAQEAARQVTPGLRKDPIQPLVIRANLGECLVINFTNQLGNETTSLHIQGLPYSADSAGSQVGLNPNTFAAPGQTITYRYPLPTDEFAEGGYYFSSHGALSRQQASHGLFGTLVLEPAGSQYLDPEIPGQPLKSGWEAIIVDPNGVNFREFVLMFHEIGNEDFEILDAENRPLPVVDDKLSGAYRPGSRAINYRSEPFYNRFSLEMELFGTFDKSHGYSSYRYGEPATPIPRSYLGEPTKTRLMHGGSEMFHVYHLHGGADRWRRNPGADDTDLDSGLQKQPVQNAHSTRIDSQSIGPGESYNLEHECGAGGCQQAAGDFLFHCHIGHHYVAGMWAFWRVFDTAQIDLAPIPDDIPAPQAVNSLGLIGLVVEGKELVPQADLTDPATQRSLEEWVESQLPPLGVPLDREDATVWDWVKVDTPDGPLYLGEPETTLVWPGYASPTPGQRPEIMFNPTNGRYAWPILKPHLAQRPPFAPNGHSGAPWLGENGSALRPDGLCPNDEVFPNPDRQMRYYPITAIDTSIQVTASRVDDEGKLFVLSEDKDAILAGLKPKEPLVIRSNTGDCVSVILTSEQLDENHGGLAKVNLHTHFVQFDPQASDGVITGLSFEQSIRPYATENRTLTTPANPGDTTINVTNVNRLRPGIYIGIGLGEGMCDPNTGLLDPTPDQTSRPCTEIRRIVSISGTTLTLDQPLTNVHAIGEAAGVEFVQYMWYSDVDDGTVFWHDHVNFKNWDHGLFGAHIIEPIGSTYHDPVTGQEIRSGTMADIHTDGRVGWGPKGIGSFREFMVFLTNNNPNTGADSGATINLRAEPFDDRGSDPAYVFSSVTNGDPFTPIFRAYVGDPVVFRGLGVVERTGTLRVTGHRFRIERFAGDGILSDAASLDISEKEDLVLADGAGGPQGLPGDYLYYSALGRDFTGGAWGILRVHDTQQTDLQPLPDQTPPPTGPGFPQLTFTGNPPPPATDPGNVCPPEAPVRSYDVSIFRMAIPFHDGLSGTDSNGVMYALTSDEQAIKDGLKHPEPLVLRVNAGECLEITLHNNYTETASLNIGKLVFDPLGSYGAAIGYNPDSTVPPGSQRLYRLYADEELGTNIMLNLAHPETGARGAFGAVIVEPAGSTYRDPHTGDPAMSGTYVDIIAPEGSFREYVALFQDEDERIGQSVMPYTTQVEGFTGINYLAIPMAERLLVNPDPSKLFDSNTHGDPATFFEAYAGDPMRYRIAQPWGEQSHVFSMEGHRWQFEPNMPGSMEVASRSLSPGEAFDAHVIDGAGSGVLTGGDYMYLDHRLPFLEAGLWGILRVYDTLQPGFLPLPGFEPTPTPEPTDTPTPIPPTDTPTPIPPTDTPTPIPPTDTPTPIPPTNTPVPPTNTPPPPATTTFNPVADAMIMSNSSNNFGASKRLGVGNTTRSFTTYLQFDLQGLSGTVTNARLEMLILSGATMFDVAGVADNSWQEMTINANNAPVIGSVINSSGPIVAGTWVSIDVTSYINGDGIYSLALTTADSGRTLLYSRESGNPPRLIVETSGGPPPTATNTP
ncbi:MAG: DNRLRE domain-containing protein, partial [Chloroflexi bacterium]